MLDSLSITDVITLVTVCTTGLLVIAGAIVKFTKNKKDDEVFNEVEAVVKPVLDAVNHKDTTVPPKG